MNTKGMLNAQDTPVEHIMPSEESPHEGTWLQWPHHHQYGLSYRNRLDATWVAMAKVLADSEAVHIIVYDQQEKNRVIGLLKAAEIPMGEVAFHEYRTDDVWIRDNGPVFVRDRNNRLLIQRWGFNGWGKKTKFLNCCEIPRLIAEELNYPLADLSQLMINEGGSVELDGNGTMLACKSSVLNSNRNPDLSRQGAEELFTRYLGATHFIWLEGKAGLEITDMHIDGFARFPNVSTLLTMNTDDLEEWDLPISDIKTLYAAKNKDGAAYDIVSLPLTRNKVTTAYGKSLGYRGSYINYYVSNKCVLMPAYDDPHDAEAEAILQRLYKDRAIVRIDVRNLYENGGMIHCVTQQQPRP